MSAINCPRCGRLFHKIVSPVCPNCEKEEERQFQHLREFIEQEPQANINEISTETGLPIKRILQYIREGRLIATPGLDGELRCVSCGKAIDSGSFCPLCAKKMAGELAGAYDEAPTKAKDEPTRDSAKIGRKKSSFHTR